MPNMNQNSLELSLESRSREMLWADCLVCPIFLPLFFVYLCVAELARVRDIRFPEVLRLRLRCHLLMDGLPVPPKYGMKRRVVITVLVAITPNSISKKCKNIEFANIEQ